MASGVQPLPPGVHIEAISEAINLFQKQWTTYVVATLLFGVIYMGAYFLMEIAMFAVLAAVSLTGSPGSYSGAFPFFAIPVGVGVAVVMGLVFVSMYYGIAAMALKQIRGYPIGIGDLFSVVRYSPRLLWTSICMGIAVVAGICLCIVPGLWACGSLRLAPFIALDQNKPAMESLSESWRVAGNFTVGMTMFGMMILIGFLQQAGAIACLVGLLATVPIGIIATCVEYFYFFPEAFGVQGMPAQA